MRALVLLAYVLAGERAVGQGPVSVHHLARLPFIEVAPGIRVRTVVGSIGSFSLAEFDSGSATRRDHHVREQVNVGLEGTLRMEVDTLHVPLVPGVMVLVPGDVAHAIRNESGTAASMIEFHTVRRDDLVEPRRAISFPRGATPVHVNGPASVAAVFEPGPATQGIPPGWWLAGAQTVAQVTRIASGRGVELGTVTAEELVFILRGRASLVIRDGSTDVSAGWLVVLPPGTRASLEATQRGDDLVVIRAVVRTDVDRNVLEHFLVRDAFMPFGEVIPSNGLWTGRERPD